jgi:hypothetical protein
MKISQLFPSKFVKAADLNGKPVTLTITKLVIEKLGHGNEAENKPVLYFERATKGMVLNRTNAMIIANLYGDEADQWAGNRICIYPTKVRAFGQMQDCIRVREEIPAVPKPVATAAQVEETTGLDDDEDVTDHGYDDNPFDGGAGTEE